MSSPFLKVDYHLTELSVEMQNQPTRILSLEGSYVLNPVLDCLNLSKSTNQFQGLQLIKFQFFVQPFVHCGHFDDLIRLRVPYNSFSADGEVSLVV